MEEYQEVRKQTNERTLLLQMVNMFHPLIIGIAIVMQKFVVVPVNDLAQIFSFIMKGTIHMLVRKH